MNWPAACGHIWPDTLGGKKFMGFGTAFTGGFQYRHKFPTERLHHLVVCLYHSVDGLRLRGCDLHINTPVPS